ncbi:MAG: histidine kinase N-terminal 7TM domain-containing protein, partial [Candidatus Omnitrophota bacterium]
MNSFSIACLLTALICFVVGLYVLIVNPRRMLNRVWFALNSFVAIWSLGLGFMVKSNTLAEAIGWLRIHYFGASFIPAAYFHFIYIFLPYKKKITRSIIALYLLGLFFLIATYSGDLFLKAPVPLFDFNYYTQAGTIYLFYALLFFICVAYSIRLIHKRYTGLSGLKKNQLKYIIIASLIGFAGGTTTFLPVLGISVYPFGIFIVFLYPLLISYAILRYRLMDIRIAVTKAGIFMGVNLLVLGIPFILASRGQKFLVENFSENWWFFPLGLTAILASLGPFIYTYFDRKAENRLRREEFVAHKALNSLAQNAMRLTDLNLLLKLVIHQIVKVMHVESASIYLCEKNSSKYLLKSAWCPFADVKSQSEFSSDSELVRDILVRKIPIVSGELKRKPRVKIPFHLSKLKGELKKAAAEVVVPAFKGDFLFGFLVLGQKKEGNIFTKEDLNLLHTLSNQMVLAIENARFFEKEKIFLAEKSRRVALADMAPGVSH